MLAVRAEVKPETQTQERPSSLSLLETKRALAADALSDIKRARARRAAAALRLIEPFRWLTRPTAEQEGAHGFISIWPEGVMRSDSLRAAPCACSHRKRKRVLRARTHTRALSSSLHLDQSSSRQK